ncbi:MAG: hypothetical protein ACXAEU_10605 [Candidatus Hodarchaeales archaeon]
MAMRLKKKSRILTMEDIRQREVEIAARLAVKDTALDFFARKCCKELSVSRNTLPTGDIHPFFK